MKIRAEGAGAGCFGCGTAIVMFVVAGIISAFLGDWIVGTLGGADALAHWHEFPVVLRIIVLFFVGEIVVPLSVLAFILMLFGVTPLF